MKRFAFLFPLVFLAAAALWRWNSAAAAPAPSPSAEEIQKMVDTAMARKTPQVELVTSMGVIKLELDAVKAPITVRNFLTYVAKGHYNGTVFHRIISDFMIQGGGYTEDRKEKKDTLMDPIKNEATNGLSNARGTIAMARTQIVDSARAQFFINVVDNTRLDHKGPGPSFGYCVFGKVIAGMDVVDKIKSVPTQNLGGAFMNWPVKPPVIRTARIVE